VLLSLDPTPGSIAAAAEFGANVLVTHHPAFLDPPAVIRPGRGGSGALFAALDARVALINAHTNLDRDREAQSLLPEALGLTPIEPLEQATVDMVLVAVYAPEVAVPGITAAMERAGAGRIGDYTGCSFASGGVGRFVPSSASDPHLGTPGRLTRADEVRLEMVCPRQLTRAVVGAAASAHPYEEPLVSASEVVMARNSARLGMVSVPETIVTLGELARRSSEVFRVRPRVWGDRDTPISRVATSTGSAGSLIGDALSAGSQALVAGEVRYHDALDAKEAGLCIVELGHDVTEWPLIGLLEAVVRSTPGMDQDRVHALPPNTGWWTT
jgi:putative NIF3 family GTP cyclohydrolase 1 type 2